jgi:hypothetical protein
MNVAFGLALGGALEDASNLLDDLEMFFLSPATLCERDRILS